MPFLTLDGQSIVRAENWRIRQGPGLDDPLIALARNDVVNEGVIPQEIYYLTDGAGRHYAVAEATGSIRTEIWNESVSQYLGARATGAVTQSHSYGEARLSTERTPGLSFFRNRVYDQNTGRWTQEDPIGLAGGINLYQFNGNDPASYDDPYGLKVLCDPPGSCQLKGVAIGGGVGAAAGGVIAAGCAGASGGICAAGAPAIVTGFAGLGASTGGLVGSLVENKERIARLAGDLLDTSVSQMASARDWLRRLLVAGGILVGQGVPARAKHSDNPPEVQQPAKPPRPDEQDPEEEGNPQ